MYPDGFQPVPAALSDGSLDPNITVCAPGSNSHPPENKVV